MTIQRLTIIAPLAFLCGCSMAQPDRAERMTQGYVFYLDGAGGGGAIGNWSGGLKQGLLNAGYPGAGEIFNWNTGMGVAADQDASVDYKRTKAAECARRIQQYCNENRGAPVTMVGLSAGTAVTVFTLEALPTSCQVEDVILCGASISADYDLTRALQRVRRKMYVFTSEKDAVLAFAVPLAGTADRTSSVSAGLRGFKMPTRGSAESRAQYAKVTHVAWRPEFARYGDFGGHTDALKAPFVQQYMAPLIMDGMARKSEVASAGGRVRNPDYERWSRFNPGAWARFEGEQIVDGRKQPVQMTAKLISKHADRLVVERTFVPLDGDKKGAVPAHEFIVEAEIERSSHPLTSPDAKIESMPGETLRIGWRMLACTVKSVKASGDFPEYGAGVEATVYQNETIPGGMAKVRLKSSRSGQPYEFSGDVVAFGTRG